MPELKHTEEAVYVYGPWIRIWHWVQMFAILALGITGYLIGSPPESLSGEAYEHYQMGYIRYIHFVAAYALIIGFLVRIWRAIAGNRHSREIFMPPFWSKSFWSETWHELKWYAMIEKEPKKYVGHNPLALLAMFFLYLLPTVFLIFTGLAMYGEGTGMGSWQYNGFSSWIIPLMGQSQDVHTWHHLAMWVLVCFIITHVYVAVREDIMSRQSIISSMISGWRQFKDNRPAEDEIK